MASQYVLYLMLLVAAVFIVQRMRRTRSIRHYSPAQVAAKLKESRNVVLLDVRTDRERALQHIRDSIHIPLNQLSVRLEELKKHHSREIICYCHSGNRSVAATRLLRTHGFNAANMLGGIAEWNFVHRI